jgi:hypothetical protein
VPREPRRSSLQAGDVPETSRVKALPTVAANREELRRLRGSALGAFVKEALARLGDECRLRQIDS